MDVNSSSGRQADRAGSLMRRRPSLRLVEPAFDPAIEWKETADAHVLVAELPGFETEDVKVEFDDHGNLIFGGERSVEEMVFVDGNWQHRQRPGFKFTKVVSIPENVDTTSIGTRFENELFHITLNKLRPPREVKSTNILEQEKKSIPQVGERSARFIEESKEKKDGKASNGKSEQNLRNGKVETSEVVNSNVTQVGKSPSNKLVQSTGGEKDGTLDIAKLSETQDDKASSNKNDQSMNDDKVGTSRVMNSSTTQDDTTLRNKLDQSQRDHARSLMRRRSSLRLVEPTFEPQIEWIETPQAHVLVAELPGFKIEDVKVQLDDHGNLIFSGERSIDEMVFVDGKWHQRQRPGFKFRKLVNIPKNVDTTNINTRFENELFHITINKLRPPAEVKSTNILEQEKKSIPQVGEISAISIEESKEKKDDKASCGKPEQNIRDGKVENLEVKNSSVTQVDKAPSNKPVQRNGGEKDGALEVVNFSATQDNTASSNKNDQSVRDDKVENSKVTKSGTTQDDAILSNKLDQIQSDQKVEIKGIENSSANPDKKALSNEADQIPRDKKVENLQATKSFAVQDDKALNNQPNQSPIGKKIDSNGHPEQFERFDSDQDEVQMNREGGEDKENKLQVCRYVSQLISSRSYLKVVGAIVGFSILLYINYTIKYP